MTLPLETYDELHELIGSLCDGAIEPQRFARLQELLAADIEAQQFYVRYLDLHGVLHRLEQRNEERGTKNEERGLGTSVPSAAVTAFPIPDLSVPHSVFPSSFVVGGALFSYLTAAVIVSLGLAIAWVWKLPDDSQVVRQSVPLHSPLSTLPSVVGRITGMVDCQWEGRRKDEGGRMKDELPTAGNGIHPSSFIPHPSSSQSRVALGDRFALASGLIEITYDSGARVILQGPVTYEVDSATGGYLSLGKMTARVENKEERRTKNEELSASRSSSLIPHSYFAVRTPTSTVTDLGTEFGVEVGPDRLCHVHVFQGMVETVPQRDGKPVGQPCRVTEGQTANIFPSEPGTTVPADIVIESHPTKPSQFVRNIAQFAASRIISVNFTHGEKSRLEPAERTGVVHAAGWNNADGSQTEPVEVILQNAACENTSARLSWNWAGEVTYPTWFSFDLPRGSREKLLDGHFAGGKVGGIADVALSIHVRDIPFKKYRAYVYYWMPPGEDDEKFHAFLLTVNGSSPISIGRSRCELADFRRYRSRTDSGNYAVFGGLSGDLTLTALPDDDAKLHTLFIAGLQIIGEPAACE